MFRTLPRLGLITLLLGAAGCGPALCPVRGTVTLADGKPLGEGMVVFESQNLEPPVTARGPVQGDGRFELSTFRPGDGVRPGRYRALVAPKDDPNAVDRKPKPPPFDRRYAEFATSGLEFEVTASGPNDFPIKLSAPARSR